MAEVNESDDEFRRIVRAGHPMDEFSAASHQFQQRASDYHERALAGDPEALRHMARAERELNHAAARAVPEMVARYPWPVRSRPTAVYM